MQGGTSVKEGLMKKLFSSSFVGKFSLSGRNGKIAIGVSETFKVVIGKCLDFLRASNTEKFLVIEVQFNII
jgi:hypothetical protein